MTPTQIEARKIFDQYYDILKLYGKVTRPRKAKECALNDVNNTLKEAHTNYITVGRGGLSDYDFFLEVKTELLNM